MKLASYNVGQKIRDLRKSKGLTINEFSSELGVSAGYLSNLETEKTETISFSLIEKLQNTYFLNLFQENNRTKSEIEVELQRLFKGLNKLNRLDKEKANYLMEILQKGLDIFLS